MYEADFYKPGIYGSGGVWANAWDVFRCTTSRVGHGRRAAVDFVPCLVRRNFVFFLIYFLRTHTACCKYEAAVPHLPLY